MPRRDFHSFRHTLANELKQQGVAEAQVAALIGHSKGGITFERYGKPYTPPVLADMMTRLDYSAILDKVKPY